MLAAGRGDRRRTTSTDCHAAAGAIIVPRGDTAVTMPTATACSRTDSPSTAAASSTSSAASSTTSASPTAAPASTTTPAMGERGPYRQGRDGESEREHSKHCHVSTAFPKRGLALGPLSAPLCTPGTQREAGITTMEHHSCHAGLPGQSHRDA